MVKMIATKPLTYDMKTIEAGEEFEVADQYVGTLVSLGRATPQEQKSTKTKPMKAKPDESEEADDPGGKEYKTRRLKAEDD